MPPTTLESLPAEILLQICEYLDRDYMASVVALARTSKYNYFAVTALLFRTIKFFVDTREKYFREVQECHDMLQRTGSFRHVHRLVVDGTAPFHDEDLDSDYHWDRPTISAKERGYSDQIFHWRALTDPDPFPDRTDAEFFHENNDNWRQLADLVNQLPALVDLIFACSSQFPLCLLQAIQHRGQCRLHISRFRLRRLNGPAMDSHEFMIASSPCLYSIGIRYRETYISHFHLIPESDREIPSYEREAAIRLVAGLAPNLKEVHIFQGPPSRFPYNRLEIMPPWKGSTVDNEKHELSQGSLRCLQLPNYYTISILRDLRVHNDFSILRTLQFKSGIDIKSLNFLTSCTFSSLTNLVLSLIIEQGYGAPPLPEDYCYAASGFLYSLPPLRSLTIGENVPQIILDSALDHHGSSLRKLHLYPQSGIHRILLEDIVHIGEHCPLLENLKLAIHRSKGDGAEVAAYKAIGSIPGLRRVSLNLLATKIAPHHETPSDLTTHPEIPNGPTCDEFDKLYFYDRFPPITLNDPGSFIPHNGQICEAFINNALDGALAQQVFWSIPSGKPDSSLPLERLKVQTTGGPVFYGFREPPGISEVMWEVSRSWEIKRNSRDDSRQEIVVRELKRKRWKRDNSALIPSIDRIFRTVWPAKLEEGVTNWWDDWHSWPLSTLDT
ncbi:hypothetical protein VE00_08507 [Pseudogymnoascus sp. WSF 3629]|nr:hypothetical protein VE00_08507 [Pseudogymnoascus sp. WSF 3629]